MCSYRFERLRLDRVREKMSKIAENKEVNNGNGPQLYPQGNTNDGMAKVHNTDAHNPNPLVPKGSFRKRKHVLVNMHNKQRRKRYGSQKVVAHKTDYDSQRA